MTPLMKLFGKHADLEGLPDELRDVEYTPALSDALELTLRVRDPEVLEDRYPVRLRRFEIRRGAQVLGS